MNVSKVLKNCEDLSQFRQEIVDEVDKNPHSIVTKQVIEYCKLRAIKKTELTAVQKKRKAQLKTVIYATFNAQN